MGVYIKGMEMPKSCRDCRFCNGQANTDYGVCAWCDVDGKARDAYTMQDCPLVPVPPHGRLIDGDKLAEEQKENVRAYHANLITLDDLAECLLKQSISEDGAPTIIEAEEGE